MKITEIELLTENLPSTETFYTEVLGLQLIDKKDNSITLLAGNSKLTFLKSAQVNPRYHFAFNIPKNKLEEAILWANNKLELITTEGNEVIATFEAWNANSIYFYDNNLNIVEFIARHDLDNASTKPFDQTAIESISEIGLVTDNPLALAEELIQLHELTYFSKSTKSESFVALGNDEGLFVIVVTNRNWYPTKQKAEKQYTKVKIAVNGMVKSITLNN